MAHPMTCNDCGFQNYAGTKVCRECGGTTRSWFEKVPKPMKTHPTRCTHAGYPSAKVQVVTCDPRTVTICTNCGLET